ncbi:hypothetical protein ACWD6R_31145 [Streptomyces sp. NPDC005151]
MSELARIWITASPGWESGSGTFRMARPPGAPSGVTNAFMIVPLE